MGLWVIINILVFSSIGFSNRENLSFYAGFWDLLSLDILNNPWRQGNVLVRQPGASRPINCLETAFGPINHLEAVPGPIIVFWKLSSNICYYCLTNQNQRYKRYLNYFYTDFTLPAHLWPIWQVPQSLWNLFCTKYLPYRILCGMK